MKKTLSTFFEKINLKSDSQLFLDSEIEMVNDDAAQEVRGGDKDYTPMYESELDGQTKWFFPSVLLNT
ncbi:hypothetical protein LV89_04237 [Arcicella aurantiaca]|uniref:Uncharacterized protein n=1 Tax=Arcicella aurantiaca TaxID=591202 RepID=A0A316DK78_9BACT|nr:hypothetical protein [Arcicella aurantiaca]PWK18086.1 hypothetical protein LV89_04237 [Arcicella aurantiaca]